MTCNSCGGTFTVGPSTFPGFDLLACERCGRPIKLILKGVPRPAGMKARRGELKRALRAARRQGLIKDSH